MVKRIKAQRQRHGRQWLLGTVSALSLLATAHAKADQVTVKDGDTVWDLANQYQTSVKAIEDANPHVKKINSSVDLIYAGQQLELSKNSTVSQTSAVDSDSYTVKSGDTLSQISERLHVSLADLVSWNHLSNPDQLVIGQQLIVKGTAAASQTPASISAAEASNTAVSVPATTNSSVSQAVVQTAPVVSAESTASDGADSNSNAVSQASQADEPAAAPSQAATSAVTSAQDLTSSTEQSSAAASSEMISAESSAADMASADTVSSFDDQSAASSTSETVSVEQTTASSTATTAAAISSADAISESASAEQPMQSTVASSVAESTSQQADSSTSLATADSSAASTQAATTDYSTAAASSSTSEQASTNSTVGTADSAVSTSSSSDLTTGSVVSLAVKLANANIPYVWGGASLSGMDCSGLVDYVFQNAEGISLPHYTVSLESCVSQHSVAEAQPGDILFWGNHGSTYHCAIYIGNNQYVAAPQPGQNVEIETISPYFMPSFAGTVIH